MKTVSWPTIAYIPLLVLLAVAIWWLMYYAQFLSYDSNYAALLFALVLSILGALSVAAGWRSDKTFVKQNSVVTILFLLSSSPLTVIVIFCNYVKVFGHLQL